MSAASGYGLYKAAKKASKKRPKDEDEARGFDIVIDTCQRSTKLFKKICLGLDLMNGQDNENSMYK